MSNNDNLQQPQKKFSLHLEERQLDFNSHERSESQKKQFVLDGVRNTSKLTEYNGLKDRHLQGFFYSKGIRRHLFQIGLITKDGYIIEDKRPKLHENYQILPVENDLYEDKTKERKNNNQINQNNNQIDKNNRAKSSKALNNKKANRIIIKRNPKNFSKISLTNNKNLASSEKNKEDLNKNEIKQEKKDEMKKKNSNSNSSIPKVEAQKKENKDNQAKNDLLVKKQDSKTKISQPKSEELKPVTKEDLNKMFEKYINKLEKETDVDPAQKEKLNKTKENILKINKNNEDNSNNNKA